MTKLNMPAVSAAALAVAAPAAIRGPVRNDMSMGEVENLLKDVTAQLKKVGDELKPTAENALKEATRAGEVSNETKAKVDALLTAQNTLNDGLTNLTQKLEGVEASNLELSQAVANGGMGGAAPVATLGQAVINEAGDKLKAFNGGSLLVNVENAITTAAGSGGGVIFPEEERNPVQMARRSLRILDLVSRGSTDSDVVKYVEQTLRTDAAAAIAESGTYPASAFGWTKRQVSVEKIGTVTHASEEALADAGQLRALIDNELRYLLDKQEEMQVLAGDGTTPNLTGLIPNATAFVAAAGKPNANEIDRLRLAILQVVLADYIPTGIVLNPTDWAGIDLLKDGQSRFIFGNPGAQSTPKLWGKDVVESNSMTAGEWLVGDFAMAATYYERSGAEVLFSTENGTDFVEDMVTVKARKRAALAIKRSAAMVKGNFTFV